MTVADLPSYQDFILPVVRAVADLGGSAQTREVVEHVVAESNLPDDLVALTYESAPTKSVLTDRIGWARSYAKLVGALESPKRGVFLLTALGKELVAMPVDVARVRVLDLDREFRRQRTKARGAAEHATAVEPSDPVDEIPGPGVSLIADDAGGDAPGDWKDVLLGRLHRLSPEGFEDFILYLLRLYGLQLERVGGVGDEGIDGIGTAPISPVLSSRVAVQVKRYDPNGKPVGREVVALFQRDAMTKGAERAILVTLGRFSEPARKAAISMTPTVELIDGERLADLVLDREVGVRPEPVVDLGWFDRFD